MKNPIRILRHHPVQSSAWRVPLAAALAAAGIFTTATLPAAVIEKADNSSALSAGAAWVGGVAPGSSDIARWDSTVSANVNNDPLGAGLAWSGIQILNPGGNIVIPPDAFNLTNGAAGINLWQATRSLTLSNNLAINASQYWQVANGHTLDLEGALTNVSQGAALLFSYDSNPSSLAIIDPASPGSVIASSGGSLLADGALGTGTGNGICIGTVNDVDFAGLNGNNQVVPASTILGYTANPTGASPGIGNLAGIYDVVTTNSVGVRIASNYTVTGMRFNTPQPTLASSTTYTYNGVGAWQIQMKSAQTLTIGDILLTTNLGTAAVVVGSGGFVRMANIPNELLIFQNNPAAPFVLQSPISNRSGGGVTSKMGPGTMELQAGCTYTGGTRLYGGTILLDGAGTAGAGPLTVFAGANFEGQSAATNFAPVSIADGATNSVLVVAGNQFVNNTNLTFNPGKTWLQFIYSNSVPPNPAVAALLVTNGTLTASNTVNINVLCAGMTVGQFPLLKYGTLITNSQNSTFPFNLAAIPPHTSAYLSNNAANSSVDLVTLSATGPLHWTGGSGTWDLATTANWLDANAASTTYQQAAGLGDNVILNDAAGGPSPVNLTLNIPVYPGSLTIDNNSLNYSIAGAGSIAGPIPVTKSGTGSLVLSTANAFSGGLNLNGGVVTFSALNNLGTGGLNFNGGTLRYNGNTDDISVRVVTFNAGGAAIDTAGQNVIYANPVGNGGAGGLTKTGNGTLTLNGTNRYSGVTSVNQGTLALGTNSYPTSLLTSPALLVAAGATLDTASSGVELSLNAGQVLGGVGTVTGQVSVPSGATVAPATNGVFGTLTLANDLGVLGGTLSLDVSATNHDLIVVGGNLGLTNGTLQLNVVGTLTNGVYRLITYAGALASGHGSAANLNITGFSSANQLPSLSDATPGEIDLVIQAGAHDAIVWSGTGNTWDTAGSLNWLLNGGTPWAFTNGDSVTFNDVGGGNSTVFLTNVAPLSVTVNNNSETYDFRDGTGAGGGKIGFSATVVKDGTGTLILETANSYTGSTTIKAGVLQVGSSGGGDLGTGSITNNASLVFDQGDYNNLLNIYNMHFVAGAISGTGTVTEEGSSPVALANNNSYSGGTLINSGVLQIGAGGPTGSLGTGPVTNNGALYVDVSGSLALSNNISGSGVVVFTGPGTVTYSGNNTYANNTYISNGIVKLGSASPIFSDGSAGDWLILDGGTTNAGALDLNGRNLKVNALAGVSSTTNGVIDNNGGSSTTTNTLAIIGNATTSYSGSIIDNSGTGGKVALVVNGGASQTLDVESLTGNTYSGGTLISNSTVTLAQGSAVNGTYVGLGTGPVTMYNSTLYAMGGSGSSSPSYNSLANNIFLTGNTTNTIYAPQRGTMQGNIYGNGILYYPSTYVRGTISGNWSNFTGLIIFGETSGGNNLGIATTNGFGHVFCTNAGTSGVNLFSTVAATATIPIGELADDGTTTISGTESGNNNGAQAAYFAVGGLNTSTNFGGSILDNVGIIKVGTGSWTLTSATLTYSNLTTVSNGVLVLAAGVTLPDSTPVTVAAPGILDVTAASPLALGTGMPQTLQGNGTLKGSVSIGANAILAPGGTNAIGTLTVTGTADLTGGGAGGGTNIMELNRTNTQGNCDELVAATIQAGGTLIVTNIGPGLINNTTYTLFSKPVSGFTTVILPLTDPTGTTNYTWTDNLATSGSITLAAGGLSPMATNPTNLIAGVSGNVLSLSWPADHQGWYLQAQTNALGKGLGTNWVDVPNSSGVTTVAIPISPTNPAVFYRMSLNP